MSNELRNPGFAADLFLAAVRTFENVMSCCRRLVKAELIICVGSLIEEALAWFFFASN